LPSARCFANEAVTQSSCSNFQSFESEKTFPCRCTTIGQAKLRLQPHCFLGYAVIAVSKFLAQYSWFSDGWRNLNLLARSVVKMINAPVASEVTSASRRFSGRS
jgi:hypothetical protein